MTDVTEHKRREERLSYLAGLLDNSEDPMPFQLRARVRDPTVPRA